MNKKLVTSVIIAVLVVVVIGMATGYYIGIRNSSKKPITDNEDISEGNNITEIIDNDVDDENVGSEASQIEENIIGPKTIVEYKTYFTECGHEILETTEPNKNMINMTEEDLKAYIKNNNPTWKLEEFSHERVLITIEKEQLCQNHYVIGEKDGKIAVFSIDEKGEKVLEQIYNDAPISLLKEIDYEKLKKGIIIDKNEDDLLNILEDYIS